MSRTDTGDFIQITCNDHTSSETLLVPADKPKQSPVCAQPRRRLTEYSLHDHNDNFYILTNTNNATDFIIMKTAAKHTGEKHWQELIPHKAGTLILGIETYGNFLVRLERVNALPQIIIRNLTGGAEHSISFDEAAYSLGLVGGYEFNTKWLRFSYSSPTTPTQVFDYNMETKERVLRKTAEIPSGHEPDDYQAKRITITARDGELIPVTLIMRKNFKCDGQAPCLLYGYGLLRHNYTCWI